MCAFVFLYVCMADACGVQKKELEPLKGGVPGGCELSCVGAGNQTLVLGVGHMSF